MSKRKILLLKFVFLISLLSTIEYIGFTFFQAVTSPSLYQNTVLNTLMDFAPFIAIPFSIIIFLLGAYRRFSLNSDSLKEPTLSAAIPSTFTHECLIFENPHSYTALGFINVTITEGNIFTLLSALTNKPKHADQITLALSHPITSRPKTYLMVRIHARNSHEATRKIKTTTNSIIRELSNHGIGSEWVNDWLGIVQLYWMCVLGRDFHEDVTLYCNEGILFARVGTNTPRRLVATHLSTDDLALCRSILNLWHHGPPTLILLHLTPISTSTIKQRIRQHAMNQSELTLLIQTVGFDFALETLGNRMVPKEREELITLYHGLTEGLWQCSLHIICAPTDVDVIANKFGITPILLDCHRFSEATTGTPSPSTPNRLLITSEVCRLIEGVPSTTPPEASPSVSVDSYQHPAIENPSSEGG